MADLNAMTLGDFTQAAYDPLIFCFTTEGLTHHASKKEYLSLTGRYQVVRKSKITEKASYLLTI